MKDKKNRSDYLKKFYDLQTKSRVIQINKIIDELKKLSLQFKNITQLSSYIASRISDIEGEPVSGSTFRRNKDYRPLLNKYHYGDDFLELPSGNDASIEASLKIRELTISLSKANLDVTNLKDKLKASNDLLSKRLSLEHVEFTKKSDNKRDKITTSNEESDDDLFEMIFWFLKELGSVEFKLDEGYVYDSADEYIIMNRTDYPKFFKWLPKKV